MEQVERDALLVGAVGDEDGDLVGADLLGEPRREDEIAGLGYGVAEAPHQRFGPGLLAVAGQQPRRPDQRQGIEGGIAVLPGGQGAHVDGRRAERLARQLPVKQRAEAGRLAVGRVGGVLAAERRLGASRASNRPGVTESGRVDELGHLRRNAARRGAAP